MAGKNRVVPASELNAQALIALLGDAEIEAKPGPGETENVLVDMGGVPFLIDPYPEQHAYKIWTARELDHTSIELDLAMKSANSFNEAFLFVRNFIYQDPADPANFRAVWDHDVLIAPAGLTSDELVANLSKVADVMLQALGQAEQAGHA